MTFNLRRAGCLAAASLILSSVTAYAQGGGAGSRGGMVMACFDKDPADVLEPWTAREERVNEKGEKENLADSGWTWPRQNGTEGDEQYMLRLMEAVSHLVKVELDEYRDVLAAASGDLDRLHVEGAYRMHPLLKLLREAARDGIRRFPRGSFKAPYPVPNEIYHSNSHFNLEAEEKASQPMMQRLYAMIVEIFRPVPGFYMRLKAAHDEVRFIHERKAQDKAPILPVYKDFEGVQTSTAPGKNCVWMKAVDRRSRFGRISELRYDPYLWHRMDIFQRVLLQLHEEFYFLASDVPKLGLNHEFPIESRKLLVDFLLGERAKGGPEQGDFINRCARYEEAVTGPRPGTILVMGEGCPGFDLGPTEVKRTLVARDAKAMVTKLLCPENQLCPPLATWGNNLTAYSPHSPDSLIEIISNNKFGNYQSIKLLLEIKQATQKWVSPILQAYATVKRFCDKGGFGTKGDFVMPNETGTAFIARARIASQDRPRRVRIRPGKGDITVDDLLEISSEEIKLHEIQESYNGKEQGDMVGLLQALGSDFPEGYLREKIQAMQKAFAEGSEFIVAAGERLEPYPSSNVLCTEIRERWRATNEVALTLNGAGPGRMPISFYENKWPGHESILEGPVPQEPN